MTAAPKSLTDLLDAPPPWRVSDQQDCMIVDANNQPVVYLAGRISGDENWRATANKVAAVHEMYEALQAQQEAIDSLFARCMGYDKGFFPSKSPEWHAVLTANDALAKARGDAP